MYMIENHVRSLIHHETSCMDISSLMATRLRREKNRVIMTPGLFCADAILN